MRRSTSSNGSAAYREPVFPLRWLDFVIDPPRGTGRWTILTTMCRRAARGVVTHRCATVEASSNFFGSLIATLSATSGVVSTARACGGVAPRGDVSSVTFATSKFSDSLSRSNRPRIRSYIAASVRKSFAADATRCIERAKRYPSSKYRSAKYC